MFHRKLNYRFSLKAGTKVAVSWSPGRDATKDWRSSTQQIGLAVVSAVGASKHEPVIQRGFVIEDSK